MKKENKLQRVSPVDREKLSESEKLLYRQGQIDALNEAAQTLLQHGIVPPLKDPRWTDELGENGEAEWLFDRADTLQRTVDTSRTGLL